MFNKVDGKKYRFVIIFSDLFQYLLKDKSLIVNFCDKLVDLIPSLSKDTTIILPTFNLKFYKTLVTGNSDCYITTGFLNKTLLKHLHFQRTKKPIGNYSVIGLDSKKILNIQQNSLFGEDSVINFLSTQSTLGVGIGIDPKNFGWTTIHSCEEEIKVPYRYYKRFEGYNIDTKQKVFENVYVRDLKMKYVCDESIIPQYLLEKKKILNFSYHGLNISFTNLRDHYLRGINILKKDKYGLVKRSC